MSCCLKRKPQKLVPSGKVSQFERQKFVPANLKKSPIRKIKVPQKFYATRYIRQTSDRERLGSGTTSTICQSYEIKEITVS